VVAGWPLVTQHGANEHPITVEKYFLTAADEVLQHLPDRGEVRRLSFKAGQQW
jgi:hypothetical protein